MATNQISKFNTVLWPMAILIPLVLVFFDFNRFITFILLSTWTLLLISIVRLQRESGSPKGSALGLASLSLLIVGLVFMSFYLIAVVAPSVNLPFPRG